MSRRSWVLTIAFLGLACARGTPAREDAQADTVRLKVSVFNDARVPQPVLRAAELRARAVFAEAKLSLVWLDCGTPGHWHTELGCQDVAFPSHLSVRLATGVPAGSGDIFGQSFLDERGEGSYVNVYLTPLASAKALEILREGDLLGCVIAHELGHLLLGKSSHSEEGLMRARWEARELREAAKGNLLFSKSETERMRVRYRSATALAQGDVARLRPAGS